MNLSVDFCKMWFWRFRTWIFPLLFHLKSCFSGGARYSRIIFLSTHIGSCEELMLNKCNCYCSQVAKSEVHEAMPLCGHLLLTVTIWSAFVGCQKPSSVSTRHDVYIAGFFPYTPIEFPESRIGRGVMPAVKLAVEHINDSPQVLRNYRLHMWWNDTKVRAQSLNHCRMYPYTYS